MLWVTTLAPSIVDVVIKLSENDLYSHDCSGQELCGTGRVFDTAKDTMGHIFANEKAVACYRGLVQTMENH